MQGQIHLGGGSLGFTAIAATLLGRPAQVTLTDLEILDPEGVEVFRSDRLTATVQIQRNPLSVVVRDLRPGQSRWRFARMHHRPGIGFVTAFLRPGQQTSSERRRRGEGRPAPGTTPAGRPAPLPPPPPMSGSFSIEGANWTG